ncbi:type II toxin-antitoxin system RelE/ParE family toxin [Sunxiuqinia sp. sy24]|uniref:type II toxin-antitoxin system RelE/ParE family toxin n=1 Tax=Sunxiuqinia sp. sy24 TaxID=3461495 RepID=UPI004045DC30
MEVIWSAKARITYFKVLDYLQKSWSKKEMIQFSDKTEIIIRTLAKNPFIFVASSKQPTIRKATIDKNNSLFYQVDEKDQKIYLLTFFDNRRNPEKVKVD